MDIYQSSGDISELSGAISSVTGAVNDGEKITYKLEPIRIHMRLDVPVYISVGHPFGYHPGVAIIHRHS